MVIIITITNLKRFPPYPDIH